MKKRRAKERRRILSRAVDKLRNRKPAEEPAATEKAEPKSGDLSHQTPSSRFARAYNPKTAPNTSMVDPRGREYDIGPRGQLRRKPIPTAEERKGTDDKQA